MKHAKKAFLASLLSMALCVTMLVGTTYAWFTDSVTSAGNKIISGTLDIDLYQWTSETQSTEIKDASAPIFGSSASTIAQNVNGDTLWEPGKTQVAYLSLKNNGNLWLKYTVKLTVKNVAKDLYEAMRYEIVPDAKYGDVTAWNAANGVAIATAIAEGATAAVDTTAVGVPMAPNAEHYFALAIHMQEEPGNEYQAGEVDFDIQVLATQYTQEEDSFDNQYDAQATYPVVSIAKTTISAAPASDEDLIIESTGEIQSATVSGDAAATVFNAMKDEEAESNELTLTLNVSKTGETTSEAGTTVALEIDMTAVMEKTKAGVTTTTTEDVTTFSEYITIEYNLGAGHSGVTATHKGNAMVNSTNTADDAGHGIYSYNAETGILTIKTTTLSPFEISYAAKRLIPVGGIYYVGVTTTAFGSYDSATATYVGDGESVEFPETVNKGDIFRYGDYEYRFNYFSANSGGAYWSANDSTSGWGVRVLDKTKTSYGEILSTINGEDVKSLANTFLGCASMITAPVIPEHVDEVYCTFLECASLTTAPELPDTVVLLTSTFGNCAALTTAPVIPDGVTGMMFTFRGCTSLTAAPAIPGGVTSMLGTFMDCSSLSGTITIDANPKGIQNCFKNCGTDADHAIVLNGSSTRLDALSATGGEYVTVQVPTE